MEYLACGKVSSSSHMSSDENLKKLSYKERKGLQDKTFAIPNERKYPINDIAHARNALARVAAFGTPEEKSKVKSAVKRKFPSVGKK